MDVLTLAEEEAARSDPYWVGRLSMTIALALRDVEKPRYVRDDLRAALEDFLRSPLPSGELKASLREEMRR